MTKNFHQPMNRLKVSGDQMRHAIMENVIANELEVTSDLWFSLIFRTDAELLQICKEMRIDLAEINPNR